MINQLDTRFIKQFRKDYPLYIWPEELQYQDYYFRPYGENSRAIANLKKWLERNRKEKTMAIVIFNLVKKNSIPGSKKLAAYTRKLINRFYSQQFDEPEMGVYYDRLLTLLDPFFNRENMFREKILESLAARLSPEHKNITEFHVMDFVTAEEIDVIQSGLGQRLAQIRDGYTKFTNILQEQTSSRKVRAMVRVEKCLRKLLGITERAMNTIDSVNKLLDTWKKQLVAAERHELYN